MSSTGKDELVNFASGAAVWSGNMTEREKECYLALSSVDVVRE
jgi:hypothetical protein